MRDGARDPQSHLQEITPAPASCTGLEGPEVFCSQVLWGIIGLNKVNVFSEGLLSEEPLLYIGKMERIAYAVLSKHT